MDKKPWRLKTVSSKKGPKKYYLVKDIKVKNKTRRLTRYIGNETRLTPDKIDNIQRYLREELESVELRAKAELSSSFYTSEYLSKQDILILEELKYQHLAFKDTLYKNEREAYEQNFKIKYIQGTTFVEGNTISLKEARDLLIWEVCPKNKRLREINEVQNYKEVLAYRNQYRGPVSLDFIKKLHALIMHNIDDESAGSFRRTDNIAISGYDYRLCPADFIECQLAELIDNYYNKINSGYHPFETAILFHHEFELIHPFTDGNGRVGREVLNYMLSKKKYPEVLISGENRGAYLAALDKGNKEDYKGMILDFAFLLGENHPDAMPKQS